MQPALAAGGGDAVGGAQGLQRLDEFVDAMNDQGLSFSGNQQNNSKTPPLGTDPSNRNGIIAARFTVDCAGLLASGAATTEQIFVTVQVGTEQRVEELTPPVVGDTPWLTATAKRVCLDPAGHPFCLWIES